VSPNKGTEQESTNSKKKKAEGENCICPVCLKNIIDCTEQNEGHDAIYCEGVCDGWLHRQCAGLSKVVFTSFQNSDKPFHCPHCRINNYELQLNNMKSTITSLEQRVNSLESQVSNLQQHIVASNNDQTLMNTDGTANKTATPTSPPTTDDSTNHIGSIISTFLNEEKEKAKRCLNLIVHNVNESTSDDGPTRKQHDIRTISSIFQQQLNITATITKAFRIGQHKEKPRLLKISVSTESEKAAILQNCIKLRSSSNPPDMQKIYITPDLTPKEQELNKKL